jgi:hypothetical protein
MSVARICGGLLIAFVGCTTVDALGADKGASKKPLVKMYDQNGDGKLGPKESVAARPARAQLRIFKALRRNAAVISGSR